MVDLLGDKMSSFNQELDCNDDIAEQVGIIYDQLKDGDINIRQFMQLTEMVYGDHIETRNYARPEIDEIEG